LAPAYSDSFIVLLMSEDATWKTSLETVDSTAILDDQNEYAIRSPKSKQQDGPQFNIIYNPVQYCFDQGSV
jgi:hypothetical protein